jgi:hypothetical protein
MYKLNYYSKVTEGKSNKEQEYEYCGSGETFRLRRDAIHYLLEIVQNDYKVMGYFTAVRTGSIYCYKSEKTAQGDRRIIEYLIKVEK